MTYHYSDPSRENEPHALPNVHIWIDVVVECLDCDAEQPGESDSCVECGAEAARLDTNGVPPVERYWYAFGFPGCLHDSDPTGPFDSEVQALEAARDLE